MSHELPTSRAPKPAGEPEPKFVAIGPYIMQASLTIARAISKTMAKRIANALNKHVPNREGV